MPFNVARYLFLDPRAAKFYPDWEAMARNQVALLRTETGRDPSHPGTHQADQEGSPPSRTDSAPCGPPRRPQVPRRPQTVPPPPGRDLNRARPTLVMPELASLSVK